MATKTINGFAACENYTNPIFKMTLHFEIEFDKYTRTTKREQIAKQFTDELLKLLEKNGKVSVMDYLHGEKSEKELPF